MSHSQEYNDIAKLYGLKKVKPGWSRAPGYWKKFFIDKKDYVFGPYKTREEAAAYAKLCNGRVFCNNDQ